MTVRGNYGTGSPADIGWMLPFFFAAWAAASLARVAGRRRASARRVRCRRRRRCCCSSRCSACPIVGYGLRYLMPLGEPVDTLRDIATACTLVCGIALVLVRLRVEQRLAEQANQRLRLLATACEQAGELVDHRRPRQPHRVRERRVLPRHRLHPRGARVDRAERAGRRGIGRRRSRCFNQSLKTQKVTRINASLARKDGSTFQTACVAAPIVDAGGRVTHFVAVIRDTTEELRLREQLVRGERLSALGEFVSGVAHEINNPLQSIIGSLELVLDQHLDAAAARRHRARPLRSRPRRAHRPQPAAVRPPGAERAAAAGSQRDRQGDDERARLRTGDGRHPDPRGVRAAAAAGAGQPRRDSAGDPEPGHERAAGDVGSRRRARAVGAHVHVGRGCGRRGARHRARDSDRARRQSVRAVLHDQVGGRRPRPRPVAVARHRQRASGTAGARGRAGRLLLPSDAARLRLPRPLGHRSLTSRNALAGPQGPALQ